MSDNPQPERAAGDPPARSIPLVTDSLHRDRDRSFWLGLLYAGLSAYWAVAPGILVYAALTGAHGHGNWVNAIAVVALSAMVVIYLLRRMIVEAPSREWVFFVWNTTSFIIISVLCALDGGIGSPLTYLFALPMLYLAIGYPLRTALICGATGLCCYGALLWIAPGPEPLGQVLFQSLTLGVGFLLAILGGRNRDQQDRALDALQRQLESLAMTDELTGCLNQRAFTVALQREVGHAARYGHALSLLLIDIDHFKGINDRHGHLVGDAVLRKLGLILRRTARETDCVGRPGGDELALLIPETDGPAALMLAERLRQQVHSAVLPIGITLSIGICAMPSTQEPAAELFRRADEALYAAKRRGRDQVALWNDLHVRSAHDAPEAVAGEFVRRASP